jgi:hypothetical protein
MRQLALVDAKQRSCGAQLRGGNHQEIFCAR